ncbi:MAG: glycosyltransferase family 2 protein [Thermoplasmata archaeon]|nr:MAG: glycosyltransferase family 2 protein [Thermoplasmata archaeon]
MKVSVVICTYSIDRLGYIEKTLKSLSAQTEKPFEIILVLDENKNLIKSAQARLSSLSSQLRILTTGEPGLSKARNKGVLNATGDIIAFIDDDAFADDRWLEQLTQPYVDPKVMCVGGKIVPLWDGGRPSWFPEELDWIIGCTYKGHPKRTCQVRNVIGCNMSFRKVVFDKVGVFEDRIGRVGKKLLAGEEMEFCLRMARKLPEAKIVYEPTAIVNHYVPLERKRLNYILKRAYSEGISKAFISRHDGKNTEKELSTENKYLKYIAREGIVGRLKRRQDMDILRRMAQILVLILAVMAVGVGYELTKVKKKNHGVRVLI